MSQNLNIQEIAIAIAAKQHNPTILTPDFLKYSGIVPSDWELAQPPIITDSVAQVVFQNSINITAQVNRIIFTEVIATKQSTDVEIPALACKYLKTLAQVDYEGVSINFRGHVVFDQPNNTARNYILNTVLNPGPWHHFGKAPVQAAMRFGYTLEGVQLSLDINEGGLQLPDQTVRPIVLFTASFNHAIFQEEQSQRLAVLSQIISDWRTDLEAYKELVNTKFLNSPYQINLVPNESVIPVATTF
ncbi:MULTISPECIES: hypothetical protein [unclassified Nostoc]|uniref:hypothetical protein n=1 Tax=unclassified Nostoc TaxID=2593658 RepID=UPI002AD33C49|nr:hypothetical protein [Nostoc sp. DedQUE03]MDZ7974248.1 hypothetical protein [Nostoc sp. DedQUE03]MDZ8045645.1 hypothetical protein [Nostoc sp. DedQUE02]